MCGSCQDVTPFKCDDCLSTKMFWIRPYSTNEVEVREREWELWEVIALQDIRQYQEFISKNEINKDMDYVIQSYEEVKFSTISLL